jgi:3-oxoacyl-[acyl-carrier-protein] synthase II
VSKTDQAGGRAPSVVITGLGATTPLGGDVTSTWSAMLAGTSGVERLTESWIDSLPVKIAAPAAADPVAVVGRVQARRMDRCETLALVAAREAWADAGSPTVDPWRLGVAVTSGIGGIGSTLEAYDTLRDKGWNRISPFTVPMLMPNGAAGWISIEFGARAGAHATVSACASGAEAIGYGIDMIRSGRADVVVAGGSEAAILPLNLGAFCAMRAMCVSRNDDPERASRPFDKGHDGFVLGEGAGIVVLESEEHAVARGARIYAVAAGAGYTSDAYHIAHGAPDGAGIERAIRYCLQDAGIAPAQVAHLNAHATSTPEGDPLEAKAISAALGESSGVVVSATKSMTGHLLGASGAVETIACVMALRMRLAPPTINLDDPDDDLTIEIATKATPLVPAADGTPMAVVNNSFGFGGHNVALAFTEYVPASGSASPGSQEA